MVNVMGRKSNKKSPIKHVSRLNLLSLIQNPRVPNKYNLTIKDIAKLKIGDKSKIGPPIFWRNNIVNAWCISFDSECITKNSLSPSSYWLGIYDDFTFEFYFLAYGDMCSYNFKEFYKPEDIESLDDLLVQEKFLDRINYFIDEGILVS